MDVEGDRASEIAEAIVGQETEKIVGVPFTITNEVPEDSKPVDEQLSLF